MADEGPDPVRVDGFRTEVSSGSRIRALIAIRDKLAGELDQVAGRDAAPLSRELIRVIDVLEQLGVKAEVTELDRLAAAVDDQLAERRARRGAATAGP